MVQVVAASFRVVRGMHRNVCLCLIPFRRDDRTTAMPDALLLWTTSFCGPSVLRLQTILELHGCKSRVEAVVPMDTSADRAGAQNRGARASQTHRRLR